MPSTPTIGNDIVDRTDPSNLASAERKRYARRVLSDSEFEYWRAAPDPSLWLMQCWAAKEAAFKALAARHTDITFLPRQYILSSPVLPGAGTASVTFRQHAVDVQWTCTGRYVHCTAVSGAGEICERVAPVSDTSPRAQSAAARRAVVALATDAGLPSAPFGVARHTGRARPPALYGNGAPVPNVSISLSHDGGFVAAALLRFESA